MKYSARLLRRIVDQLDSEHRNVVEFRHRSWWNERVFDAFREGDVTFCSVSAPRLPDELVNTNGVIYLRFHGRTRWYRYDYSRAELEIWAKRIATSGAQQAWMYFNNDPDAIATQNARSLRTMIVL